MIICVVAAKIWYLKKCRGLRFILRHLYKLDAVHHMRV